MKKQCSKCQQIKLLSEFYKDKRVKSGLTAKCKVCFKKSAKIWSEQNRLKSNAIKKAWALRNPDKVRAQGRQWKQTNKKKSNESCSNWRKKYPEKNREKAMRYKTRKLSRMPNWLTKEQKQQIKDIYNSCPKGHHVDHVVPLCGENVSGLHVPWNLQIILASDNISKSNKFDENLGINLSADYYRTLP